MRRFVVSLPLRPGSTDQIRRLLREGPPFDLSGLSLERHEVFLSDAELIFLFEGTHSERVAIELLERPRVLGQASRIAPFVAGPPRFFSEAFSWEAQPELEGLSFGALPGPGHSEGGQVD